MVQVTAPVGWEVAVAIPVMVVVKVIGLSAVELEALTVIIGAVATKVAVTELLLAAP